MQRGEGSASLRSIFRVERFCLIVCLPLWVPSFPHALPDTYITTAVARVLLLGVNSAVVPVSRYNLLFISNPGHPATRSRCVNTQSATRRTGQQYLFDNLCPLLHTL